MNAIILAIHGLGGRGAWFDNLKNALDEHGVELIAPDLKGFGNNEPRGHVESFNDWVSDIQAIYEKLKTEKIKCNLKHEFNMCVCVSLV